MGDDLLDDLPSSTSFALDALDDIGSTLMSGGAIPQSISSTSMSPITTAAASSHVIVTAADQSGTGVADVEEFFANAAAASAPQWAGQQREFASSCPRSLFFASKKGGRRPLMASSLHLLLSFLQKMLLHPACTVRWAKMPWVSLIVSNLNSNLQGTTAIFKVRSIS